MDNEQAKKQEMMARIVSGLAKPLGWRADREPDATWHRPSSHRPGMYGPSGKITAEDIAEKCRMQKEFQIKMNEAYQGGEHSVGEINEQVRLMNKYLKPYGCPATPEFPSPLPTITMKR